MGTATSDTCIDPIVGQASSICVPETWGVDGSVIIESTSRLGGIKVNGEDNNIGLGPIFTTHELCTKTGDGRDMVVVSGYGEVDLFGNEDGTWNHKDLSFRVGPEWRLPPKVVPVVSMTSIMNVNIANNAGWAVDDCTVEHVGTPGQHHVFLHCPVATRDRDGILYRVNYYVTMVGELIPE